MMATIDSTDSTKVLETCTLPTNVGALLSKPHSSSPSEKHG